MIVSSLSIAMPWGKAIGFLLAQVHDDELRPITFGGRLLSDTEQRYATLDKELLACLFFCFKEMRELR